MSRAQNENGSFLDAVLRPGTVLGALLASLVVGTALTVLYQGAEILNGRFTGAMLARLLLTYLVPYAVYTVFAALLNRREAMGGNVEQYAPSAFVPPEPARPAAPAAGAAPRSMHAEQLNGEAGALPAVALPELAPAEAVDGPRPVGELRFTLGPKRGERFTVRVGGLILGREDDSDILLDDPLVSRHHVRIRVQGARFYVEDLGSRNGTLVNGEAMRGATPLTHGDRVQIGESEFEFRLRAPGALSSALQFPVPELGMASKAVVLPPVRPSRATARLDLLAGSAPQPSFALSRPVMTIGRGSENDIVLQDSLASRRHARILEENGEYYFDDLGSANGSRVNQQRLQGRRRLSSGDEIAIGGVRLRFVLEQGTSSASR